MAQDIPSRTVSGMSLALALIESSLTPVLLLNERFEIVGASDSFCGAFDFEAETLIGASLAEIGAGEWNIPQLRSLLRATFEASAAVDAYEMELLRDGHPPACIVMNAQRLDHDGAEPFIILAITDITAERLAARTKDDLIREKEVLLRELQHRIANSLQIIASVLMQSARRVQSEESRQHLQNAYQRVMSLTGLQKQLAVSSADAIPLRQYFSGLCDSIGASMIDEEGGITLNSTTDGSSADANKSTSLGLIVTELVINALKHAFPDRNRPGHILVDYRAQGAGFALTVSDNGVGIAASDEPATPGLGTGIVDALSRHLGAVVERTDTAPGTKIAVVRAA